MWKNYFKIALRNIQRYKGYTFLNVGGLALGIAACLLISFFIRNELSYDTYHADAERLYRVALNVRSNTDKSMDAQTSANLARALESDFSQVERAARLRRQNNKLVKSAAGKLFYEDNFFLVDPWILDVFTIPLLKGDAKTALNRPSTLLITQETANRYFGEEDPIGKVLNVNNKDFEVTGVMQELPYNSHLKFNMLTSFTTVENEEWYKEEADIWYTNNFYTYLKVKEHIDIAAFEKQVENAANKYIGDFLNEIGFSFHYFLQPIQDIHLHSNLRYELEAPGNPINVYIFSVVAVLVLLIASLNYINLTTAQAARRAKEVGVRSAIGADKKALFTQFVCETLLLTTLALGLALLIVFVSLPVFENLSGQAFKLEHLFTLKFIAITIGLTAALGVAVAIYPALFLSSFKPVSVLKGNLSVGSRGVSLRKVLVVCQFSISMMLIVGTIMVYRQLDFMKNKELGFDKEQMLILPVRGVASTGHGSEQVKNEFQRHSSITNAASSLSIPGKSLDSYAISFPGASDDKSQTMFHLFVDFDFMQTYGIKMAAGRSFDKRIQTDAESTFLLNEQAVKAFGWSSPEEAIGKKLSAGFGREGEIIGVYKDFHYRSLQSSVEPLVLAINPGHFSYLSLRTNTNDLSSTMAFVEEKWSELFPQLPFEYYFLDEEFNKQYLAEEKMGQTFMVFTAIAICIACLGLFGLATLLARQRTKEIGIRKVLGASVAGIVALLSRDFIKLILISLLIATPLSYYLVSKWLENFASRIPFGWETFAIAGLSLLLIALFTVGFQSVRAARENPVKNLRTE